MSAKKDDYWDTSAGQLVVEAFSSIRFRHLLKTTLAASGASLAHSNFNLSTGLTNSLAARAARTALCLQAHYEPQHKGCRPVEGKEPAIDSASRIYGFAGNTVRYYSSAYHERGMSIHSVTPRSHADE